MATVHVLSTARLSQAQLDRLRAVSSRLRLVQHVAREADQVPASVWADVEVLCTFQALPDPASAEHLRWVQLLSAGVDHVFNHPVFDRGVLLTTSSGIHAINIAELVLAMMLAWGQRLPDLLNYQRRAEWPAARFELFSPHELRGATIGIVGYGSIGREVGRLAASFGMRVLAFDEREDLIDRGYIIPGVGDRTGDIPERHYRPGELLAMLVECDYVVLAVPLTKATWHLIGLDELRTMKPTVFLINIARGSVVDERALIHALQESWIAGAGLDVFSQEPLPADSPLWSMENVLVTPHIAGLTPHYNDRATDLFEENLRRYLDGQPLLNQVDFEKGY